MRILLEAGAEQAPQSLKEWQMAIKAAIICYYMLLYAIVARTKPQSTGPQHMSTCCVISR